MHALKYCNGDDICKCVQREKAQRSLLQTQWSSIISITISKLANFNNIDRERKYIFYYWNVIIWCHSMHWREEFVQGSSLIGFECKWM